MALPDWMMVKVHVTPKQREELAFLVNRRISDIRFTRNDKYQEELDTLNELKKEINQAGT